MPQSGEAEAADGGKGGENLVEGHPGNWLMALDLVAVYMRRLGMRVAATDAAFMTPPMQIDDFAIEPKRPR